MMEPQVKRQPAGEEDPAVEQQDGPELLDLLLLVRPRTVRRLGVRGPRRAVAGTTPQAVPQQPPRQTGGAAPSAVAAARGSVPTGAGSIATDADAAASAQAEQKDEERLWRLQEICDPNVEVSFPAVVQRAVPTGGTSARGMQYSLLLVHVADEGSNQWFGCSLWGRWEEWGRRECLGPGSVVLFGRVLTQTYRGRLACRTTGRSSLRLASPLDPRSPPRVRELAPLAARVSRAWQLLPTGPAGTAQGPAVASAPARQLRLPAAPDVPLGAVLVGGGAVSVVARVVAAGEGPDGDWLLRVSDSPSYDVQVRVPAAVVAADPEWGPTPAEWVGELVRLANLAVAADRGSLEAGMSSFLEPLRDGGVGGGGGGAPRSDAALVVRWPAPLPEPEASGLRRLRVVGARTMGLRFPALGGGVLSPESAREIVYVGCGGCGRELPLRAPGIYGGCRFHARGGAPEFGAGQNGAGPPQHMYRPALLLFRTEPDGQVEAARVRPAVVAKLLGGTAAGWMVEAGGADAAAARQARLLVLSAVGRLLEALSDSSGPGPSLLLSETVWLDEFGLVCERQLVLEDVAT